MSPPVDNQNGFIGAGSSLDNLEALLGEQLSLVGAGRLDRALDLCDSVSEAIEQVRRRGAGKSGDLDEQLERITELHRRVGLSIAVGRDETARKLKQLRHGKTAVKAYGRTL